MDAKPLQNTLVFHTAQSHKEHATHLAERIPTMSLRHTARQRVKRLAILSPCLFIVGQSISARNSAEMLTLCDANNERQTMRRLCLQTSAILLFGVRIRVEICGLRFVGGMRDDWGEGSYAFHSAPLASLTRSTRTHTRAGRARPPMENVTNRNATAASVSNQRR